MNSKKIKLYVLIPDKSSGDYFNDKLKKHNIETEYGYYYIHPRVINNKLTSSRNVGDDMNSIFKTFTDTTRSVVIACNTLQLWLDDIKPIYKKHVKIYTTFEACEWRYNQKNQKPLWLGTTPLVERTRNFPTLLSLGQATVQNQVQEIIWRIKMLYGDDIQTAFPQVKNDKNLTKEVQEKKITDLRKKIVRAIKDLGVKKAILGCTELPMIFPQGLIDGIEWIDPAEVLAEYVKHQSTLIMFAGGTISSLANKEGKLIGGHIFNLVERLSKNMPGSFKHLNITNSDIIYTGLSENLNFKILHSIWEHLQEALSGNPSRIVITHGTDAMEQTAQFIEAKLAESKIKTQTTIVLTGSNLPPNKRQTDVWKNLRYAINAEIPNLYPDQKVFIAFDHRIIPAKKATKIFLVNKNAFVAKDSFTYSHYHHHYSKKVKQQKKLLTDLFKKEPDNEGIINYEVNKIRINHEKFIHSLKSKNVKAVLFKLYHSGTANSKDRHASVAKLVEMLTQNGVVCFGATETGEPTNLHTYETSYMLLKAGMIPLYNMLYDVGLYKLSLLGIVKNNLSRKEIIEKMLKNCAGEIDEKQIIHQDIRY